MSTDMASGSPTMDYDEHHRTYSGFIKGTKYLAGIIVLLLILMAIFLV